MLLYTTLRRPGAWSTCAINFSPSWRLYSTAPFTAQHSPISSSFHHAGPDYMSLYITRQQQQQQQTIRQDRTGHDTSNDIYDLIKGFMSLLRLGAVYVPFVYTQLTQSSFSTRLNLPALPLFHSFNSFLTTNYWLTWQIVPCLSLLVLFTPTQHQISFFS